MEREEEEGSNKTVIRKITYKGEVEIEAEKIEAIEVKRYPYKTPGNPDRDRPLS